MKRLFISYSRKNDRTVYPIVKLLRITGASTFLDVESIAPGEKWSVEIVKAIEESEVVLVFWSMHSSESEAVKEECQKAISLEKVVVPVLLDRTTLSEELSVYQAIDLTELRMPHSPEGLDQYMATKQVEILRRIFDGFSTGKIDK